MAVFKPHSLGGYDENLHSFPGLSSTVANDVRNHSSIVVFGAKYDIIKDKYIWCFSYVKNRYIGALLPMFECKDHLQIGDPIYDTEGSQISIVTYRHKQYYALSGIGYESLDLSLDGIGVHHHILEEGKAVYGKIQRDYTAIKELAKEMNSIEAGPIVDYHIWIGESICQITAVDENGKEVMRVRFKKGAVLQIPNTIRVQLGQNDNENLFSAISALLNSGGGVIEVTIPECDNPQYTLMKRIVAIREWIHVHDHIDIIDRNERCYMRVYACNEKYRFPSTRKTNLYIRTMISSIQINYYAAMNFLCELKETGGRSPRLIPKIEYRDQVEDEGLIEILADELFSRASLQANESFNFTRSTNVKVTSISGKQLRTRLRQQLPSTIASFANTEGGFLFIGLDGNTRKVIGFDAGQEYLDIIGREIEKRVKRLHVVHFCEKKEDIKYAYRFIKVYKPGDENTSTYVCAIKVERFCCAVFTDYPESWYIENGDIKRYTPDEWASIYEINCD
ncbi:schlafen [Raccoonpox virus]|uniref:Schlafen-like protein n=1 Tax=Raccoon poxvirus TaxID=10256 RepID=A0A0G3G091_RACVI|nr:Schlafen-like protein [Raccoonpox virus]AKJ93809.1 Schlafen-like protein [Raccoonpox virus]AOP31442.1 schlafen [Raccoonpox virus]